MVELEDYEKVNELKNLIPNLLDSKFKIDELVIKLINEIDQIKHKKGKFVKIIDDMELIVEGKYQVTTGIKVQKNSYLYSFQIILGTLLLF